jgi:uncharacterized protein CbrC (UPF0167 family)
MTPKELPSFKYHPDPISTGSIEASDTECVCCGLVRGYIYTGPVYAVGEHDGRICPWCIADGSAHEKLGASFQDEALVGGDGGSDEVPKNVMAEVVHRTPGFSGWQQEQWWTHCGDAAQFLGCAGHDELVAAGPQAVAAIRASTGLEEGKKWRQFFEALDKDGSPRAYLFKCSKCGLFGGYQDCD